MSVIPKDVISSLLSTALSYAKCSPDSEKKACILYSLDRETIVSMGFHANLVSPERAAKNKIRWLDAHYAGDLYAICTHAPTRDGAVVLLALGITEVFYNEPATNDGLVKLKGRIPSTRLIYV